MRDCKGTLNASGRLPPYRIQAHGELLQGPYMRKFTLPLDGALIVLGLGDTRV